MFSLSLFFLKQLRAMMVIEEKISGRKKSVLFSLSLCRSSSRRKRKTKEKVTATKERALRCISRLGFVVLLLLRSRLQKNNVFQS